MSRTKAKGEGKRPTKAEEFVAAFGRLCQRYKMQVVGTPVILPDGRLAARVDVMPVPVPPRGG